MPQDQILNEALKSISKHIAINKDMESIIKLILENLILSAKVELLKEINERRE